ncbi:tyrosine-protein phosphatase [Mesonia maritima]|uniref:protein-tyrosine-phosphatase n=1 Tax=Mesonia maritima TaxID=1793873 RepID=A0ABU1K973_9FLAO|nr:CpsB/CapC family capsule biosynthesis tyrosine phosphatase [Mesonia maritima]MDR6301825.1 protein-tyrosine phosphatase [Mesonia maritima]
MSLFFPTKIALSEVINGMVDIHNHLLPGIDDGAQNEDETLKMLNSYANLGIKKIVTSPHVMEGNYPNSVHTIQQKLEQVQKLIEEKKAEVKVEGSGAEYMLEENFRTLLKKKEICTIAKKYVLVEMSYFQAPLNLEEIIFEIEHTGYIPILAHPERYNFYKDEKDYAKLLELGCKFQLNLLSLSRHYGEHVQKKAFSLLKKGSYTFLGTDAHHEKHLEKIATIKVKKSQAEEIKKLVKNNNALFKK